MTPNHDFMVSVIISNYNYGRYIDSAIQSALEQSYHKVEVIVVDDGSTDNSRSVIKKYRGKISSIFRDHNGQCSALNAGFYSSVGDVIIFLDSDDKLHANAVERFVRAFRDNQIVTKCQAYMNAVDVRGDSLGKRIPEKISPSGNYKGDVLARGPQATKDAWTSGNAWARWFLEQVMPLPEYADNRIFADGVLNPLAAVYGPIVTLEEPIADYRIHGHNSGPISKEFSVLSLSTSLRRKRSNYEFIAKRAESLGLEISLEDWYRGRTYWKDTLKVYAISLIDGSQPGPQFREVVTAPFATRGLGTLRATVLAAMLAVIWLAPRKLSLEMIRHLLQLPQPQKKRAAGSYAH